MKNFYMIIIKLFLVQKNYIQDTIFYYKLFFLNLNSDIISVPLSDIIYWIKLYRKQNRSKNFY